jgi:hypothetical protein
MAFETRFVLHLLSTFPWFRFSDEQSSCVYRVTELSAFKPELRASLISQSARSRASPSLRSLRLGLPLIDTIGFKLVFRPGQTHDLKPEPIDVLNQTKIGLIDQKTFNANLREPAALRVYLLILSCSPSMHVFWRYLNFWLPAELD